MPDGIRVRVAPAPLKLLAQTHALQLWRRVKSLREQSRLLTGVIGLFVVGYLGLAFWLFYRGLLFVAAFPGLGTVLTERLFYVMFACLFGLLLLSNLVIGYTNLFRNRETAFLLTQPVGWEVIFRWKFIESTLLASWAFLFLIAPLLVAFGLTHNAPWHFYPVTLASIGLFIVLPGVLGAWIAIHLARWLDRRSFQVIVIVLSIGMLVAVAFWFKGQANPEDIQESRVLEVLDRLLIKTRVVQHPLLPSFWLTTGVLQWADGVFSVAIFFMLVLASYALFFGFLAFTRLGASFYNTASAVQSRANPKGWFGWRETGGQNRAGLGASVAERVLKRVLPWLRCDLRAMLIKDARIFWRDTTQWGQSMVLFGLLGVYILNLRHFTHDLTSPFWINVIAYLNLSACSLNLATLTTRFVYPQFSLEGHRLWIVGMAPLGLARVVKAKYWQASVTSFVVTCSLIVLSSHLLQMNWAQILYFGAVVSVMTFTLNGLSVGLGVLFPNFRETNPNKIVSGFGGTLCLVLSFLYILGSVLILAFGNAGAVVHPKWIVGSLIAFLALSVVMGWVPIQMGLRSLKDFEI